jgi:hypothetical protein
MRTGLLILLILLLTQVTFAQNIVPNGSFEVYDTCPNNINGGLVRYAIPWINPTHATPDYYNACDSSGTFDVPWNSSGGHQNAYEGNAYIGLVMYVDTPSVNLREYTQVQLITSLQADSCYKLSFNVSIGDLADYYQVTNFDAYFSPTAISSTSMTLLAYMPQFVFDDPGGIGDTSSWSKVEGIFQAQGGENYMTIGNFHDDSSTVKITYDPSALYGAYAYYFIDSVSLIKVTCPTNIGIEEQQESRILDVFPNPSCGGVALDYSIISGSATKLVLFDITGRLIRTYDLSKGINNRLNISENNLEDGVYFFSLVVDGKILQNKILIISKDK